MTHVQDNIYMYMYIHTYMLLVFLIIYFTTIKKQVTATYANLAC